MRRWAVWAAAVALAAALGGCSDDHSGATSGATDTDLGGIEDVGENGDTAEGDSGDNDLGDVDASEADASDMADARQDTDDPDSPMDTGDGDAGDGPEDTSDTSDTSDTTDAADADVPDSDAGPDPNPAQVELIFPRGVATTNRAQLTVRGLVADEDGVAAVMVNGVDASVREGEWAAQIPLNWGTAPLEVTVRDDLGHELDFVLGEVERSTPLDLGLQRHMPYVDGTLYLTTQTKLVGVRQDGQRFELGDIAPGDGRASPLAYDPTGDRLLLAHRGALYAYDRESGVRATVAMSATPPDVTFENPAGLVVDAARNRVVIVDNAVGQLVAVDLDSGHKSVQTPAFRAIFDVAVAVAHDRVSERVLIIDAQEASPHGQVLSYALEEIDRDIISFSGEEEIDLSRAWALTSDGTTAWATAGEEIVAIALDGGARRQISNSELAFPGALGIDPQTRTLFIGDFLDHTLHRATLVPFGTEPVAGGSFPVGQPAYDMGTTGMITTPGEVGYVGRLSNVSVDLATGVRTVLPSLGARVTTQRAWDPDEGALYATVAVRTPNEEIHKLRPGVDDEWALIAETPQAAALLVDGPRNRLLVAQRYNRNGFLAVDLDTHQVTPVFGEWLSVTGAVITPDGETMYALAISEWTQENRRTGRLHLYEVDLATGVRVDIGFVRITSASTQTTHTMVIHNDELLFSTGENDLKRYLPENMATQLWENRLAETACPYTGFRLLPGNVVSHGGICLWDLQTGEQVLVTR